MIHLKSYKIFESKSDLKFTKQPKKKGAKTETFNVSKDDNVIGQIKWSSRMRGYAFLPTTDSSNEIKEFIKELMVKEKKKNQNNLNTKKNILKNIKPLNKRLFYFMPKLTR